MTRREDFQSASATLQNMPLAADRSRSLDLGRRRRLDAGVKAHFGPQPVDEKAGVLHLGYPDEALGAMAPVNATRGGDRVARVVPETSTTADTDDPVCHNGRVACIYTRKQHG